MRIVHESYSRSEKPFSPGDVIEDHCGRRFGVYEVEVADGTMSRYTCLCFSDGATYSNLPHYTMKLVEDYESICERNSVDKVAGGD